MALSREPVDAVRLALKKAGGSADLSDIAVSLGLPELEVSERLHMLANEGVVERSESGWRLLAHA